MPLPVLTDEHEMLRRTVRAFVEKEVVPHVDAWEEAGRIPRAFWRRLGELGLLGLEFPTEYGGGGGDFLSSVVLGEEMARCRSGGVAFSVLVHTDMSSPWLTRYGTEAQKRAYLPGIVSGETVCALGITEPGAGSDMAGIATRAVRDGDRYLLTGSKTFITNGVYGDLYFVAARVVGRGEAEGEPRNPIRSGRGEAEGEPRNPIRSGRGKAEGEPRNPIRSGGMSKRHHGISMFLVERGAPGFTVSRRLDKMGMRASDTAELSLQECPVPAANLLGEEGRGFHQLAAGLQRERIMAAVLALSGAAQALEDTTGYLRERHAFDGPLSAKQALRHRVADLATEIEAARHLVYHAAALYTGGQDCVTEVSMAKLFATEVANRVAYQAVQLHGGYGYMREFHVERFFRDVRLWTIASGTSEIMREIIAKRLLS